MFIVRHKSFEAFKAQSNISWPKLESINLDDFEDWSPWSKCRKRCKQVRTRTCKIASCESTILKEERDCTGHRCLGGTSGRHKVTKPEQATRQPSHGQRDRIRVLYHLQRYIYSPWSEWSACKTRTCHTTRYRVCMNSLICKNSIIKEDALCYTPGSDCERQYKPQVEHQPVLESLEEIEPTNKVTSNLPAIDDQECGYVSRHATIPSMLRIIGGRRARRWPWMVAILNRHKQHFCGGTIIHRQFVVTAG